MREIGLYEDPGVYDILNAPGTAEEVDGLEKMWRRWGSGKRGIKATWEAACGTGRYLRLAARRGYRVLGIDRSAPMVGYARERIGALGLARRADLRVGDMTRLPRDWRARVDFAFNLINSIRHLTGDAAVLGHFRAVAAALRPGGIYCVGITSSSYGMEFPSEDGWEGRRGLCRVKQVIQYEPPATVAERRARVERVFSHVMVTRGSGGGAGAGETRRVEHRDSRYVLRTYSRRQWESLIARGPLRVKAIVDEEGVPLHLSPSGYGVWVLGRRDEET